MRAWWQRMHSAERLQLPAASDTVPRRLGGAPGCKPRVSQPPRHRAEPRPSIGRHGVVRVLAVHDDAPHDVLQAAGLHDLLLPTAAPHHPALRRYCPALGALFHAQVRLSAYFEPLEYVIFWCLPTPLGWRIAFMGWTSAGDEHGGQEPGWLV